MSRNGNHHASVDRRALRTRNLLAQALIELGAANDVDLLEVGDLAQAAGVARSPFYTHFASKDDFLVRSFVDMIGAMATRDGDAGAIVPARALFQHVHEAGEFARNIVRAERFPALMAAGEVKLRAIAEENLSRLKPDWDGEHRRETAIYVAGGLMGLLRWWMESGLKKSPEELQCAFDRLSRAALADS